MINTLVKAIVDAITEPMFAVFDAVASSISASIFYVVEALTSLMSGGRKS